MHENVAQIIMSARSYSCAGGKVEIAEKQRQKLCIVQLIFPFCAFLNLCLTRRKVQSVISGLYIPV
uniref:Uncharacterized protein n=1 Tax=Triticum urartu TaxID=4572 RepID=A0A8R7QBH2_TRIUA